MSTRALLLLLVCARVAHADVIALPETKATIDLPKTWTPTQTEGVVLGANGPGRELLAITRAPVPNPDAWRAKTRDAYVDHVEQGIATRVPGYQRTRKQLREVNTVPTLDLEARRAGGATLVIRVLLFRTYALALAIEVPKRTSAKAARRIAASFALPQH